MMNGLFVSRNVNRQIGLLKSHFHNNFYEIYYLKRGSMRYIISDRIFELKKNDVALIPRGIIHNTSYDKLDTERLLINFSDEFILNRELLCSFEKGVVSLSEKYGLEVEGIFKKIEKEAQRDDEFSKQLISQYIGELMIIFIREDIKDSAPALGGYPKIIQCAVEYINKNFGLPLSLNEISEKFSFSKSFFSKKFKEITGFGLSEYITLVRIKNAEKLLIENKLSVTEIAYASGFNDSSYFAATFKKIIGITPLRYAKIHNQ